MLKSIGVAILLLLAGCGRLGFGDRGSDGGGAIDSAPLVDGAPQQLVDLTAAAPLLTTENPISQSCGQYLITFASYDLDGVFWRPSVVGIDDTAYFFIPCKYSDMGNWSMGLASYVPTPSGAQVGAWIDGDAATAGINELIKPTDLASSGLAIGSLGDIAVAWDGTKLAGVGSTEYAGGVTVTMPITLTAPTQLSALDFSVGDIGQLDIDANDGTWRGASTVERSVTFRDGAFDIFTMQNDTPTKTGAYIVVDQVSESLGTITLAQAPLLTGASHPIVTSDDANIYLISIDSASTAYQLRVAATIAGLASATPHILDLARFQGAAGSWNHDLFAFTPRGEPRIFGAWSHDGALLIYYLAGDTDYTADTAPYGTPRAIGVLSMPLPPAS